MAKKKPARPPAKRTPSKPPKARRGGGAASDGGASPDMDSATEKNFALAARPSLSSRINSSEREQLLSELLLEIGMDSRRTAGASYSSADCIETEDERMVMLEKEVHSRGEALVRLRIHLYRALSSPTLPDERSAIAAMLRRAPTAWHIRTIVEEAIEVLVSHSRREEMETASLRCLGEIARLFRNDSKRRPRLSVKKALEHPTCIEALKRPTSKRTRGGTDGNDSIASILTWTERFLCGYDKQHNPDRLPAIYAGTDEYLKGFLRYAKEEWDIDGPETAEVWLGKKIRTNSTDPKKPKQSFGFFKKEIETNARRIIAGWLNDYAPNVRQPEE